MHRRSWAARVGAMASAVLALCVAGSLSSAPRAGSTPNQTVLPGLSARVQPAPTINGGPPVSGPLHSPGGPYLMDSSGRVVFLHGVNVVYKHAPYEVYPDPGKPWNFDARDASLMAKLGFNFVRLGVLWRGLEPGTAPANDPAICTRGRPSNPHQFNQRVLDLYLAHLKQTVDLLGQYHIYTMLDMHQDVYNEMFDGEGAPNWAVCTNGVKNIDPPGRWSLEYSTAAAGIAFHHFWTNNVVGDLQGEFDRVWGDVAQYFKNDPWVVGYDPFNEPFSRSLVKLGDEHFDAQLECFYTGTTHIGRPSHGAPRIRCPANDPAEGVIPTILSSDPRHLVFEEPDNYASRGFPTFIGPIDLPNLVYNVHIYCQYRSPVTGNPTNLPACAAQDTASLAKRSEDRPDLASTRQKGGPAWFVSEFGASSSLDLIGSFTRQADVHLVGWAYWSWKYYRDPTGSADEALVMSNGRLRRTAQALSQTYPMAIAGTPVAMSFSPSSGVFHLSYRPTKTTRAPTVLFVPVNVHYPTGYCLKASGATVVSGAGTELVGLTNKPSARTVVVDLKPGACSR
jgi:endoglycosylceramidase